MNFSSANSRLPCSFGLFLCALFTFLFTALPTHQLSAQDYRLATGDDYGAVIDAEGNLFLWGAITSAGDGSLEQVPGTWREVSVSRSSAVEAHILLIATDGTLWSFGTNDRGQLGVGDQDDRAEPVQISGVTSWVEVAAGAKHSLARNAAGQVFAWGDNTYGQLNVEPIFNDPIYDIQTTVPGVPISGDAYISIAAGNDHSHAIRSDGTLWAWGSSGEQDSGTGYELGILINGDHPVEALTLERVGALDGWTRLFGGYRATFALRDTPTETGQLWVWGSGGNLGTGDTLEKTPKRVGTGTDWAYVSQSSFPGNPHTLALKADDSLWGWGSNWPYGQLGLFLVVDGVPQSQNRFIATPRLLEAPDTFLAVGAGDGFSAVIDAGGFMLTAGRNDSGQLATGTIDESSGDGREFFDNSSLGVADLDALSVTVNEQLVDIAAGETISVSFEVQNIGTGPLSDDFEIEARLNTLDTFGGEPLTFSVALPSFTVTDDFDPGQSRSIDVEVELPTDIAQGSYFIVMRADSTDVISENSEINNDAATETTFSFLPDLIVPEGPPNGLAITSAPGDGFYDPGTADTIDIELDIRNIGNGTLPAGSTFDVRVFLSPDRSTTNSAIVELNPDEEITLAIDLESGSTLSPVLSLSYPVPFMPAGSYFVGIELDINDDVDEQPELLNDNNVVVQVDGETNNAAYSDTLIPITGLTIAEAVDRDVAPILTFETDGDGEWFGQASFSNDGFDAAQSPSLGVVEWASFSTSFSTPVAISFDWSANTSNQSNRLQFRVVNGATGGNNNTIAGNTDGWIENVTRVIPLNARAEWVFIKDAEGDGDAVYVDDIQFTEITEPDLVIDDIYLPSDASGSYVLQRDLLDLTVNSRNQGTSTTSGEEYIISIYLSPDPKFDRPDASPATPDDILIHQQVVSSVIEGGDPAVNGISIELDTSIESGLYYLIGYIDDFTDGTGALLPGKTSGTGEIVEFTGLVGSDPFPGEDNNTFVTDSALVQIIALPDIQGDSLSAASNYYLINDPETGYSQPNELPFSFSVSNQGLAAVNESFDILALFSRDQIFTPESDYTFLEYRYEDGFGAIGSGANVRTISPDSADFRQNIVTEGYIGSRLFFGVFADSSAEIEELFENNNSVFLFNNNLILSEFTLQDALDVSEVTVSELDVTFVNDQQAPYDTSNVPWVGQSTVNFDGFDAATNVIVGDNETSKFSIELDSSVPVRVSFWWRVSSEDNTEEGQRDFLGLYIDPGLNTINFDNADLAIYGIEEEEWRRVEVVLDAGPHTLTWAYVKDGQDSAGEDRGWIDQLTITELPNLAVTAVSADGSQSYQEGDTINAWSVVVENQGEAIEAGTAFDVQIRLLPAADWVETGAITLLTITDDTGIGEGESRSYSNATVSTYASDPATVGPLTLPVADYDLEYYFFGAYVDWLEDDPASGQISESDESESDNTEFTEEASIQIGRPDITGAASSIAFFDTPYEFGGSNVDLDISLSNIGDGALSIGSSFDYSVYISRTDEEDDLDSSSAKLLAVGSVAVPAAVGAGDPLDLITVSAPLPYGLANGAYFIGVKIDTGNDVLEQGLAPDGTGTDGEANNVFFSSSAVLDVAGMSLFDALNDDPVPAIPFMDGDVAVPAPPTPYINQGLDSTALWFGRDESGDAGIADNQIFANDDGAQTPELQVGEYAEFSLTVPTSSLVRFDWRVFSGSDQNVLSVLVNDVVVASISGDVGDQASLIEIDPAVLVPDNGVVTWRYTKGAATVGDFAYVDNLRIENNDDPDLVLTALNYTAGEYVLDIAGLAGAPDQLLGTEYLDITVEATNQGESVIATNFTTADIEVRLSTDRTYGNDNDIILGTFSQVEGDLLSGNLIRFIGPIQLGDSIPENSYYLIARIDSNDEVSEFSESNNILVSANRDVVIKRLPALRLYNPNATVISEGSDGLTNFMDPREAGTVAFDVDETLNYSPESPMRLRFSVQNIGLDRIQANEAWSIRVDLVGALREDLESAQSSDPQSSQAFFEAFDTTINLGDFTVQQLMNGRSEAQPEGQVLDFDVELAIPSGARFVALLPEDRSVLDYLWCIEIDLDANDEIEESSIVREFPSRIIPSGLPWRIINPAEGAFVTIIDPDPDNFVTSNTMTTRNTEDDEGAFGIYFQPSLLDAGIWESGYGLPAGSVAGDDDLLFAYAFNRNPADTDTSGQQFPGTYGISEVQGDEYLSISFDFVTRATDLEYVIEAADDVAFTTPDVLLTITPPFTGSVGATSLTGDGGLIDEANVLGLTDQGYSARITVRDSDPVGGPSRFMRVRVNTEESTSVP